jgi:twitching motility protein PilU
MRFSDLLRIAAENDASDLYLIPESPLIMRVLDFSKEEMIPIGETSLTSSQIEQLAGSITNADQKADFDRGLELDFAYEDKGMGRFRINLYRSHLGTSMVCRLVRSKIPTIDELGLPPVLKDLAMEERGLILIVGSVGSGKSSTLAAMLDHRNIHRSGHILTVEDPLEFLHEHKRSLVSQREVGIDTESYSSGLKNVLRQAPDVIAIGEIRDLETMSAAIHFAETGHLLLSTLHSTNSHQALERIINFYPSEFRQNILLQLSLNLKAIVSQRLIPRVDGTGQIAAVGVLRDTPRIKDLIAKEDIGSIASAVEERNREGMLSIDQSIYSLYERKIITAEDALRFADSPNNMGIRIRRLENTLRQQEEADKLRQPRKPADELHSLQR